MLSVMLQSSPQSAHLTWEVEQTKEQKNARENYLWDEAIAEAHVPEYLKQHFSQKHGH